MLGLLGYTNLGHRLRATRFDDLPRMDGRLAVVTGATSGLGTAAAAGFAALGARVVLVVRDAERGERVRAGIGDAATVARCDLSSLADVRALARTLQDDHDEIEVLVHNAGVLPPERRITGEGHELTLATNVLAPFLLTALLADRTRRVVNVTSGGMYTKKLDVDELLRQDGAFNGTRAYANTKRAEVVLTEEWADRLDPRATVVHAMHPGWADTPGLAESLPGFHRVMRPLLRDPRAGADTILFLGAARAPLETSGRLWLDRATQPAHYVPWTREAPADRARLWDACVALTGEEVAAARANAGGPTPP
jgi:dehydrogenase/reductase SDR family member 12